MEKESLSFWEAVGFIAGNHRVPIEYIEEERSEEQMVETKHRESLLIVLEHVREYFLENLRTNMSDESRMAREYVYGRWTEEFCSVSGIGYAPKNGSGFMEYCRRKSLNEEALFELGLFKRGEDGCIYPMLVESNQQVQF